MPLPAGSMLGTYEVLSPLGAGGMGEVYRARDTRLGREVAIKVLPAERLHDEHRRRRFVQEAQSASALNHPHIITIYEIESAGDIDFIVMEYVRGRSLDVLIPRQGLRLHELLRMAIPVADALAAAHASGIIHRDLKPANVMVGSDGAVKVLDFGLAKLIDRDVTPEDPTATQIPAAGLSAPGIIVGTTAYMAPEQATGGKVDARSDIFSFGAMLYEMATGSRAFAGASVADTLAAVLRAQPTPPTQRVAGLPRALERLILRCLRKEPERRYQTMLDVKNELQEIKEESDSGTLTESAAPVRRHGGPAVAAAVSAIVVVGAAAWVFWPRAAADLPAMRVVPLTSLNATELFPALSPDGEQVAFSWNGEKGDNFDVYLKLVGSSDVRRLTTDPGLDWTGGWSPDGRQIACLRVGPLGKTIYLVSPVSGTQRKLIDFPDAGPPLTWSPDGRWLVVATRPTASNGGGVYVIPVDGGAPRRVAQPRKAPQFLASPAPAPDGRHLAYLACEEMTGGTICDVEVVELDERWQPLSAPRRLTNQAVPPGLIWSRDGTSVIYATQPVPETFYLWRAWVNGEREPERLELAGLGARMPAIASAQNRLAFVRTINRVGVFTLDTAPRPVLVSSFWDIQPQFSPDGAQLAFTSSRSGETLDIWLAAADGSNSRQLTHGPGRWQGSPAWSPEGRRIAFDSKGDDGRMSVWTIDADGGPPRQITKGPGDHNTPTWSRDGRWIYFSSDQGAGRETWRVPAGGGAGERVMRDGSAFALESMDGKELIYKPNFGDSPLVALPLAGGPARQVLPCVSAVNFAVGPAGIYYAACGPRQGRSIHLFDTAGRDRVLGSVDDAWGFALDRMAVSPDGQTVLIHRQSLSNDLMLIENFK
jgi:eukaryotic-like serine/threonine-protein kinase